jgi:hypothetical protein
VPRATLCTHLRGLTCDLAWPLLAGIPGFTAFTNSQIADTHPVYGLPSGWAFAIWGIIFAGVGVYTAYQALPASFGGGLEDPLVAKVRVPMLALLALNMAWIFLFGSARYWAALVVIVLYDVLLFTVLARLDLDYFGPSDAPLKTKLCVGVPCSIHAGWVTVACALQLQVNLLEEGWLPSPDFAIGALVVALGIASVNVYVRSDLAYALASVWACAGIISQQRDGSRTAFGCASRVCAACDAAPALLICQRPNSAPQGLQPNGWATLCAGWEAANTSSSTPDTCFVARSSAVADWALAGLFIILVTAGLGIGRALLKRYMKVEVVADSDADAKTIEIHGTPSSREAVLKSSLTQNDGQLSMEVRH